MASLADLDWDGHLLQTGLLGLRKPLDSCSRTLQHSAIRLCQRLPRRLHCIPIQHHRLPLLDISELGRDAHQSLLAASLHLREDLPGCVHSLLADGTPPLLHIGDALADELDLVPWKGDLRAARPAGHLQRSLVQDPLHIFDPNSSLLHTHHSEIQQVRRLLRHVLWVLGVGQLLRLLHQLGTQQPLLGQQLGCVGPLRGTLDPGPDGLLERS
mmetsp:Transcript_4228/g.9877  ORF Transcript_4228/g.9877 Transcript_4228/m.9877 type:complete len:213 (-) Transcript_4228:2251-2889(-)